MWPVLRQNSSIFTWIRGESQLLNLTSPRRVSALELTSLYNMRQIAAVPQIFDEMDRSPSNRIRLYHSSHVACRPHCERSSLTSQQIRYLGLGSAFEMPIPARLSIIKNTAVPHQGVSYAPDFWWEPECWLPLVAVPPCSSIRSSLQGLAVGSVQTSGQQAAVRLLLAV